MAISSPIEICIEIKNSTSHGVNRPGFKFCHTLCIGGNHNPVAASISKLLVVLVAPTQHEQAVHDAIGQHGLQLSSTQINELHTARTSTNHPTGF